MMSVPLAPLDVSYAQFSSYSVPSQAIPIEQSDIALFNSALNVVALIACLSLAFSIIWHKKRHSHRQMLQQQREMLERLWQLSSTR